MQEKSTMLWRDRKRTVFGLPLSFTVYSLDSDRLFIESGLFTKTENEVRLYRILDISLVRTFGQRIFGVGTIKCCSADKTMGDFEIRNIKKPHEVKEMLSQLIEKERMEKRVSNREFMSHDTHDEMSDDYDDDDHG
jgi:uncharacterized membrane protein YdbT with pleckstrin-like domain